MGWIFNGSEFIKANKAQQKAYDDFKRHELAEGTLAQPFAIPTLGVLAGVLVGGLTITGIIAVLFGPAKDAAGNVKEWTAEKVENIKKTVEEAGVTPSEAQSMYGDFHVCVKTVGGGPLGGIRILNCMRKKGWADDLIIEMINPFD